MVNVNAHLPFDLYNQHPRTASSSRSASAQRAHSYFNSRAHNPHTPVRFTAPVNLGRTSTSRSQSSTSLSRNNSASRSSSLYYNSIDSIETDIPTRHPTLNVRLVKGPDADRSGAQFLRQGRRRSRFGEPGPNEGGTGQEAFLAPSRPPVEAGGEGDTRTPPQPVPVTDGTEETGDPEDVVSASCHSMRNGY